MNINKEREAFEAEFSKIKSDIAFWLHTWDEEMQGYNHPVMCWFWHMWQAKKTSHPEGFVLVPREPTQDMMIAALAVISTGIGKDHIDVEIIQCWKKMIEAQEQSHD